MKTTSDLLRNLADYLESNNATLNNVAYDADKKALIAKVAITPIKPPDFIVLELNVHGP